MRVSKKLLGMCLTVFMIGALAACGDDKNNGGPDLSIITPGQGAELKQEMSEEAPSFEQEPVPTIEPSGPVTFAFVGDIVTSEFFRQNYEKAGGSVKGVVDDEVYAAMTEADICVANHEYCTTDIDSSNAADYQIWVVQAPTQNEHMFTELGIDVCSLANNHAFDYGTQGFLDTLENIKKQGIVSVGAGLNIEEATDPKIVKEGGKSIAFFSSNAVITRTDWIATADRPGMSAIQDWTDTYKMMIEKVGKAKEENDLVICLLHFGTEGSNMYDSFQQRYARAFIDAGADVIIGDHCHVVQGVEYYNDGVIFYCLSNFIFSTYHSDTMVVRMNLYKDNTFDFNVLPCTSDYYYTERAKTSAVFDTINNYSVNAYVTEDGNVHKKP